VDAMMEAARERANEIATAAIPDGEDAGMVRNAAGVLALHTGVDRDVLMAFLGRRSEALFAALGEEMAAHTADGAGVLDVAPLFAGALGLAFLTGCCCRGPAGCG
jgi:hypothetical protein